MVRAAADVMEPPGCITAGSTDGVWGAFGATSGGKTRRGGHMAAPSIGSCAGQACSRRAPTHSRKTNRLSSKAPEANTRSPGIRIQTSMWMSGRAMNSAERAYQ